MTNKNAQFGTQSGNHVKVLIVSFDIGFILTGPNIGSSIMILRQKQKWATKDYNQLPVNL